MKKVTTFVCAMFVALLVAGQTEAQEKSPLQMSEQQEGIEAPAMVMRPDNKESDVFLLNTWISPGAFTALVSYAITAVSFSFLMGVFGVWQ